MFDVLRQAVLITGFVAVMMLAIEYINVVSQGRWQEYVRRERFGQYFISAFLGATPGCLGAFAVVAMYSHRRVTLGAVVAAMIATSGDESFVMFAMFPQKALLLAFVLFVIGLTAGIITDLIFSRRFTGSLSCNVDFVFHPNAHCICFSPRVIIGQWRNCSAVRGILSATLLLFLSGIITGQIGPPVWNWVRVTITLAGGASLFIAATVPDHFLDEHLWKHVLRSHVPRVFLWTFGALAFMHLMISNNFDVQHFIGHKSALLIAGLVGLIPESGPHMIFVTMFAKHLIPFSVLLTSSIVQDGHGMLPMLAHSRIAFFVIKCINLIVGLAVGSALMFFGH